MEKTARTRASGSRCCTPRLPTPETSRSSLDGSETSFFDSFKLDFTRDTSMYSHQRTELPRLDPHYHHPAPESRGPAPGMSRTPPYHSSDAQRPSLPSLKLILGESIASPPHTPTGPSTPSQLVPREPVCNPDPYVPPSFYPNKKQKTDIFEPLPPLSAPGRFTSQAVNGVGQSPIETHSTHLTVSRLAQPHSPKIRSPLPTDSIHGDRFRAAPAPPPHSLFTTSATNGQKGSVHPYDTQPPTPKAWEGALGANSTGKRAFQSDYAPHASGTSDSRVSYPSGDLRPAPMHAHSPNRQYPPPAQERFKSEAGSQGNYGEARHPKHLHPEVAPAGYQRDQPSNAFVSAPYEYCYPKARKRSNLPKHSTEIMRTWFDRNMDNPYPSEEQKALFSNATGISMTQVSNWFINHRRRCPELRDRRAERRKGYDLI